MTILQKKREDKEKSQESGDLTISSNDYDGGEVLAVSIRQRSTEWILDSGCTYHMCPKMDWFHSNNKVDVVKSWWGTIWSIM